MTSTMSMTTELVLWFVVFGLPVAMMLGLGVVAMVVPKALRLWRDRND